MQTPETLNLQLTPRGHLLLLPDPDAPGLSEVLRTGLAEGFGSNAGHGLLYLGASQVATVLPTALAW